jgi:hypothetical protein
MELEAKAKAIKRGRTAKRSLSTNKYFRAAFEFIVVN